MVHATERLGAGYAGLSSFALLALRAA